MGVRDLFGHLIGGDLVEATKPNPAYYERAFALAGVGGADAIVVDDSAANLAVAGALGAFTVLIGSGEGVDLSRGSLAELPEALRSVDSR